MSDTPRTIDCTSCGDSHVYYPDFDADLPGLCGSCFCIEAEKRSKTVVAVGKVSPVCLDMYIHPTLLGEHVETVDLDLTTKDGVVVWVSGRVTVWESTETICVDLCHERHGITRETISSMIQNAVRQRLLGSDIVRAAVERGFRVKGYA